MKKFILILCVLFLSTCITIANDKHYINEINKTNFINKGYLSYDLNSYIQKYNLYIIDVMLELDPGGDIENIKCPYGDGYITHAIYATKYSPKYKFFKVKYKGFMCSIGNYEYKNGEPRTFNYIYKGVYYDNKPLLIPNSNIDYFKYLKNEINNPNEYNYFGIIKTIKN